MHAQRREPEEEHNADQSVGNSVPRRNKRAVSVCRYLSPIERNGQQRDARPPAEDLVDNNVIGTDPAREAEDAEERRDKARKPVPAEGTDEYDEKVSISRDRPAVRRGWVRLGLVVETVEEGGVDECSGPNHGR